MELKINKLFATFLVIIMACLLCTLTIFDTLAIIEDANAVQTQFQMIETGGNFGNSLFMLQAYSDGWTVEVWKLCSCRIKQLKNASFAEDCLQAPIFLFGQSEAKLPPARGPQNVYIMSYDVPGQRDQRNFVSKVYLCLFALKFARVLLINFLG